MTKRNSRLVIVAVAVCAAAFYFSCSQPDDILTQVVRTDMYLSPQLLPTNPDGMIYELWVANQQDTVPLGRFGYHQTWLTFCDENGSERSDSNHFILDADIFDYSHIFVSVETKDDALPDVPGPIMLIDAVTEPSSNPIKLRFPLSDSLWLGVAAFNMETPSDSNRDTLDGYGVWFSAYLDAVDSVRDTLVLDSFSLVTKQDTALPPDTFTTYVVDIINDTAYDTARVFGLDTLTNTIVRFDSVVEIDSVGPPYTVMDDGKNGTRFYYTVGPDSTFRYDKFVQFDFGLPDYDSWHWKYKGWVVSPEVSKVLPDSVGKITLPAYRINTNPSDSLIPGVEGGLLTTGTFRFVDVPDDSNQFSIGPRVPPIPGEDFLANLPFDNSAWQGLMPNPTGNSGAVFVTLEPDNFVTDTTNFPLFVLVRRFPSSRAALYVSLQEFMMDNLTPTNRPTEAFPKIVVDIKRY